MRYTHTIYRKRTFYRKPFEKVINDFKRMVDPLRNLGAVIAGADGSGPPAITQDWITFNGVKNCRHPAFDFGMIMPAPLASGIIQDRNTADLKRIITDEVAGHTILETRACDGICSHNTFRLERKYTPYDLGFGQKQGPMTYCEDDRFLGKYITVYQTAYKPYDLAVNVCLIIAKHHLGDHIVVMSNGIDAHWNDGRQLCRHFLGYGEGFMLETKNIMSKKKGRLT